MESGVTHNGSTYDSSEAYRRFFAAAQGASNADRGVHCYRLAQSLNKMKDKVLLVSSSAAGGSRDIAHLVYDSSA